MKEAYVVELDQERISEKRREVPGNFYIAIGANRQRIDDFTPVTQSVVTEFLAVYEAAYTAIVSSLNGELTVEEKLPFASMCATSIAAQHTQKKYSLPEASPNGYAPGSFTEYRTPRDRWRAQFREQFTEHQREAEAFPDEKAGLATLLVSYASQASTAAEQKQYDRARESWGRTRVKIGKYDYGGLEDLASPAIVQRGERGSKVIIGNDHVKDAIRESMVDIIESLDDDLENRVNKLTETPHQRLLYGPPGVGKTSTVSTTLDEVEDEYGVKILRLEISTSSRSSVFSETAMNIRNTFNKAREYDGPVALMMDDVDGNVASRNNPQNSSEELTILLALFEELDGYAKSLPKNVLVISTTNRVKKIDSALRRRLKKGIPIRVPGPVTPEECTAILKQKLEKAIVNDYLTADLQKAGVVLCEKEYKGSQIEDIALEAYSTFKKSIRKVGYGFGRMEEHRAINDGLKLDDAILEEAIRLTEESENEIDEEEKKEYVEERAFERYVEYNAELLFKKKYAPEFAIEETLDDLAKKKLPGEGA